ncbi:MAG: sdhA [Gammaproteobacteria bacterium]|jgi:succinate dehydrogenase / fumarate reductase flavoprotein subunit|nr:sdhA [Gammaproteobacteria bacterium]
MAIARYEFDAIIVGAGGAGLRAAIQLAQANQKVAVISKVFPTRSHTVSAQGGMAASLGNAHPDDWRWHMYDTVKGSDYLGDQDCIEYMCEVAPQVVYELEHMGMPFSRQEDGRIYQRAFGGMSKEYDVSKPAQRTCAAADRTGHALLHTLYQANIKHKTEFFTEWYALDLIKNDNAVVGVTAIHIETGEIAFFHAKATVLATGGAGRIFESTTNAYINTGDGIGMALRAGLPVQDIEFWQFHPTGIAGAGVLVTEGCRGEGGVLRNKDGERFMERYAPNAKDLASRDVVSRASTVEIREGRGVKRNGVECVLLDLTHLGEKIISERLPGIRELAKTFAHVDPVKEPIPVVPTSHYMMGGIPTNIHGQAITQNAQGQDEIVHGLYAIGECASVSVHGANRLGSNSLLDLIVFGRAAGIHITENLPHMDIGFVTDDHINQGLERLNRWESAKEGENMFEIRAEMKAIMQRDFGVFRKGEFMEEGFRKLKVLQERLKHAVLPDHSKIFNTMRIEALELDNLMSIAMATAASALFRTETRGSHSREDFPDHDNVNWLKHTLYFEQDNRMSSRAVNMKPTKVEPFPVKERVY